MYELVLLVHGLWFHWLLLSLDMIGMFHIIHIWFYPYVIPMIPLCGNHGFSFLLFGLWLCGLGIT